MARYAQKNQVIINGADVSTLVAELNIPRFPVMEDVVDLRMFVSKFQINDEGGFVIHIDSSTKEN